MTPLEIKKCVISVGHSSAVGGEFNENLGVNEYGVAKDVAFRIDSRLREVGVESTLIDAGALKKYISYKINNINYINPDLALEFHFDSFGVPSDKLDDDENPIIVPVLSTDKSNPHILYWKDNPNSERIAKNIAFAIDNACLDKKFKKTTLIAIPCKGYDIRRYWFLRRLKCLSMIVELGWMHNDKQIEEYMNDNKFKNNLANNIVDAICMK